MYQPKKTKYRKFQRGRNRGKATSNNQLAFGHFGLQSLSLGFITERQIEAARRALTRYMKRGGKVWIRVFPDINRTKLPAETRMGKGKGAPEFWEFKVKPGTILFELAGIETDVAQEALRLAKHKLPFKTKFITKKGLL